MLFKKHLLLFAHFNSATTSFIFSEKNFSFYSNKKFKLTWKMRKSLLSFRRINIYRKFSGAMRFINTKKGGAIAPPKILRIYLA